ncbi:hypothetical protein L6164_018219 [Bauhinia variegata]|uniref:Uncharacterized protein n=1 Tax=Bauhinia variegata TaxID=167791 RepID=A0ACB9NAL4_BAUVA|nr:hypothetical protein L6164_018219 [Bauhinia variegata]
MAIMDLKFLVFLIALLLVWETQVQAETKVFNVINYGAVADGSKDNAQAFLDAWNDACQYEGNGRMYIPSGTYQLNHVQFKGPCNGGMEFMIQGTLKAPTDPKLFFVSETWINFQYVSALTIYGGGTLDGQGASAWKDNTCSTNPSCRTLPTALRLDFTNTSQIRDLVSLNSKNVHLTLYGCDNVEISNIKISAPGDSPNTDGIKMAKSKNIRIIHSDIGTGDDCIAMLDGLYDIQISGVTCGPGHGISIGSLADSRDIEDVSRITVRNCRLHDTTNGLRLKTWASPYKGRVFNLTYEDIVMENVQNPIIIDQNYCPHCRCNSTASSHVHISNVRFKNIRGTSSSEYAVTLNCSQARPCTDMRLEDIKLEYKSRGTPALSSCSHARGASYRPLRPLSCL